MKPNAWVEILNYSRWCRTGAVWTVLACLVGGLPAAANSTTEPPRDVTSVTPWMAVAASGSVQARTAIDVEAVWRDVSRGDELLSETHVKTGRKGRATLTRSSSLLLVAPDSEVELPADGYSEMETSVIQTSGSVLYEVDGRANPHFEVVTPYLVAGVKGTSFLVTVNEKYTSVTVRKGLVEISNPDSGETFDLRPGESVIRHRDDPEMELVYDRRRSRDARHEAKKLDRMDRDKEASEVVADLFDPANDADQDASDSLTVDPFGSPNDPSNVKTEEIDKELLEEMIGEGVHDGSLRDPGDVPLDEEPREDPGELPVELPPEGNN